MNNILKAFTKVSENENIKITQLEKVIGASKGVLSRAITNNSDVQAKWFLSLVENYPQYNIEWLVTGNGEMLKQDNYNISLINKDRKTTDSVWGNQDVPLYNLEAVAGLKELFINENPQNITDTIKIPNLPKCDGAVKVIGDSMYPLLKSGDIILYKETIPENIFFGEMYLLSIQLNEWEEYITVKYLQKSEEGKDFIKLVSQNQHHQPKDIHLSQITALAMVKASIRMNTMM
ncbi:S24 family peptidase [Paenimyroides baculatum]|uniref:Helix-turn-helix transcriptional regulator n=1 Tax=Paenimyroides baculatum TaxID=2608000 RepID=A0A5M6CIX3_9FLAO|nr:S24 family peptidase [Paenimyroides baculatum]KAA5533902.1 helix-turn-helix transcriptional regulator [Paenimyroides baculatum]